MTPTETFLAKCLEVSERATLKEKIGIAIGEASMCWDPLPSGVFDSTDAIRISKELESDVFAVIDRLPKVCEALKICMQAFDDIDELKQLAGVHDNLTALAFASRLALCQIAKDGALQKLSKLFDDADGG